MERGTEAQEGRSSDSWLKLQWCASWHQNLQTSLLMGINMISYDQSNICQLLFPYETFLVNNSVNKHWCSESSWPVTDLSWPQPVSSKRFTLMVVCTDTGDAPSGFGPISHGVQSQLDPFHQGSHQGDLYMNNRNPSIRTSSIVFVFTIFVVSYITTRGCSGSEFIHTCGMFNTKKIPLFCLWSPQSIYIGNTITNQ